MSMFSYMLMIALLYLKMLRMLFLGKYFELKQESIKPPDIYLGGHMRQVTLDNGVKNCLFDLLNTIRLQWKMAKSNWRSKVGSLSQKRYTLIHWLSTIVQRLTSLKSLILKMCHTISPWLEFFVGLMYILCIPMYIIQDKDIFIKFCTSLDTWRSTTITIWC